MKQALKKYFIPHAENNYHPHILHTKRAILYSVLFIAMKCILFLLVMLLPATVFMLPEILQEQQSQVIGLTNTLREEVGKAPLSLHQKLVYSAGLKADDMAAKQYFSHTSPENNGLAYFLRQAGYSYRVAGENLGMGFSSAADLVNAWVNSPTHYKNIIDTDFVELGVNLSEGLYEDTPTVYVVQHFGTPKQTMVAAATQEIVASTTTTDIKTPLILPPQTETSSTTDDGGGESIPVVSGEEEEVGIVVATSSILLYDEKNSKLGWKENDDGSVHLVPQVFIKGEIREVEIEIEKDSIRLHQTSVREDGAVEYAGEADIRRSVKDLFLVVLPATLKIVGSDGEEILDTLAWENPMIISPTPIEKYTKAEKTIPFISSVFDFARSIYTVALVFFSLVLLISIVVEVKRQHPHIIMQTLALLSLLVVLVIS